MSNSGVTKTAQEALTCKLSADLSYGSIFSSLNACPLTSHVLERISLTDYYQNYANVVVKKQNPLLNRFYLLRQHAMHAMFVKLLTSIPSSFTDAQVLVLGGGYDISYEFYNDQNRRLHYYVIDFPEIIERRMMYHAQRSQYPNKQFHYIGGDLLDFNRILQQLEDNKIDHSRPTIVLIECVLSYLPFKNVEEIVSSIASKFSNCAMLLFDPLMGSDPIKNDDTSLVENQDYFHQTKGSFSRKEAELQTNFSTSIKVAEFFRLNNWNHIDCMTMFQVIHLHDILKLVEPLIINSLEVFDEFSSLQMLLNNYHITVTMNNTPWWRRFQANPLFNPLEYTRKEKEDKFNLRLRLSLEKVQSLELVKKSRKVADSSLNICIREAISSDILSLEKLYSETFQKYAERSKSIQKYIKNASKDFRHLANEDNQFIKFWVCIVEENIVGCVGLKKFRKSNEVEMHYEVCNFCVSESYRRRGIGKTLVQSVIGYSHSTNQRTIELTVIDQLSEAIKLYKSIGFEVINSQKIDQNCTLYSLIKHL